MHPCGCVPTDTHFCGVFVPLFPAGDITTLEGFWLSEQIRGSFCDELGSFPELCRLSCMHPTSFEAIWGGGAEGLKPIGPTHAMPPQCAIRFEPRTSKSHDARSISLNSPCVTLSLHHKSNYFAPKRFPQKACLSLQFALRCR